MKHPKVQFAPPGFDPTSQDFPIKSGPKLSGFMLWISIGAAVLLLGGKLFFDSVKSAQATVLPTQAPTILPNTATPTATLTFTSTSTGTITPQPTATATRTSAPSATPTATTIPPGVLATWTPGPWLVTRYAATQAAEMNNGKTTPTPMSDVTPTAAARPRR